MPSCVYWGALDAWGITRAGFSTDGFFHRQHDYGSWPDTPPRPTTRRPANRSRATASTRTCCRRPTVC